MENHDVLIIQTTEVIVWVRKSEIVTMEYDCHHNELSITLTNQGTYCLKVTTGYATEKDRKAAKTAIKAAAYKLLSGLHLVDTLDFARFKGVYLC